MLNRPAFFSAAADLLFPRNCPGCEMVLSPDDGAWCQSCAERVLKACASDYCPRCGVSVGPHLTNPNGCGQCRKDTTSLDGIARVGPYETVVGDLVKRYKLQHRQRLDKLLGSLVAAAFRGRTWCDEIEALVPVPSGWFSRVAYRFHPTGLIAASAGHALGLASLPLVKVRGKKRKQMELPASARPANVRGVFHVRKHAKVEGATLCVLDDVATTGSTLKEMARVLKKAGAAKVYGLVVATTNPNRAIPF